MFPPALRIAFIPKNPWIEGCITARFQSRLDLGGTLRFNRKYSAGHVICSPL